MYKDEWGVSSSFHRIEWIQNIPLQVVPPVVAVTQEYSGHPPI